MPSTTPQALARDPRLALAGWPDDDSREESRPDPVTVEPLRAAASAVGLIYAERQELDDSSEILDGLMAGFDLTVPETISVFQQPSPP